MPKYLTEQTYKEYWEAKAASHVDIEECLEMDAEQMIAFNSDVTSKEQVLIWERPQIVGLNRQQSGNPMNRYIGAISVVRRVELRDYAARQSAFVWAEEVLEEIFLKMLEDRQSFDHFIRDLEGNPQIDPTLPFGQKRYIGKRMEFNFKVQAKFKTDPSKWQ